jgi:hypothetical protein
MDEDDNGNDSPFNDGDINYVAKTEINNISEDYTSGFSANLVEFNS